MKIETILGKTTKEKVKSAISYTSAAFVLLYGWHLIRNGPLEDNSAVVAMLPILLALFVCYLCVD